MLKKLESFTSSTFQVERSGEMAFRDNKFLFAIAHHRRNGNKIAHYYFVKLSQGLQQTLFQTIDAFFVPKAFEEFQRQLLEKEFFMLECDLRWNLYLILLTPIGSSLPDNIVLEKIESNGNYARKYVLNFDELDKYLYQQINPIEKPENNKFKDGMELVSIWFKGLKEAGLYKCLTPFYKNNVDVYCDGCDIDAGEMDVKPLAGIIETNESPRIETIKEISFRGFRPHCFGDNFSLKPGRMSLLVGPNGSGKTSILEGIELACTGGIFRLKDHTEERGSASISCEDETGNGVIISQEEHTKCYKQREQDWYNVPMGRDSITLGNSFARFNFLNCEAVYRVALETDKEDFYKRFSQLVLGEEIIRLENNIKKYRDGFLDKKAKINKKLERTKDILRDKKGNKKALEARQKGHEISILAGVNDAIKLLGMKKGHITFKENAVDKVGEYMIVLEGLASTIGNFNEHVKKTQIYSKSDLDRSKENLKNENQMLTNKKNEIEALKAGVEKEKVILNEHKKNLSTVRRSKEELDYVKSKWTRLKQVCLNEDKVKKRRDLEEEVYSLEKKKSFLERINDLYPDMAYWSIEDIAITPEDIIIEDRKALRIVQKREAELQEAITELEAQASHKEALTTQIQTLGTELAETLSDDIPLEKCPLCGVNHYSTLNLKENIRRKQREPQVNTTKTIIHYRSELKQIKKEIKQMVDKFDQIERNRKNSEAVKNVLHLLNENISEKNFTAYNPQEALVTIQESLSKLGLIKDVLTKNIKSIQFLEGQGFTLRLIEEAEDFVADNKIYYDFASQFEVLTFDEYLMELNITFSTEHKEIASLIERQEQLVQTLNDDYTTNTRLFQKKRNEIKDMSENIQLIDIYLDAITQYFDIKEEVGYFTTIKRYHLVYEQLKAAKKYLLEEAELDKIQDDIDNIKTERIELKEKLKRCNNAIGILNKMPQTRFTVKDFVEENLKQIESLFLQLHTPREFTRLDPSGEQLSLIRNDKRVEIFQTSYGQRMALALSIMLTMHLSASRAPKFILLDDPICHFDDMHFLGLLDVLRRLVLSGHQVIMTTPNNDVAELMRRKFSFLGEQYKEFTLMRYGADPLQVIETIYDFDSEKEKDRRLIRFDTETG